MNTFVILSSVLFPFEKVSKFSLTVNTCLGDVNTIDFIKDDTENPLSYNSESVELNFSMRFLLGDNIRKMAIYIESTSKDVSSSQFPFRNSGTLMFECPPIKDNSIEYTCFFINIITNIFIFTTFHFIKETTIIFSKIFCFFCRDFPFFTIIIITYQY